MMNISASDPKITVVVNGPSSYHLRFNRLPQFGHNSADLLTSWPQSLHTT